MKMSENERKMKQDSVIDSQWVGVMAVNRRRIQQDCELLLHTGWAEGETMNNE